MERTLRPEFEAELKTFLELINENYNYDFRGYAPNSMKRTIVHAMNRMGYDSIVKLQEKVLQDTECFNDLIQSLTISVSEMFRDSTYFLAFRENVIPILKTYPSIKVWIAGCSTGEEVYSIAIILEEEELLEKATIYATDINQKSLDSAENGGFSLKDVENAAVSYKKSGGKKELSHYYSVNGSIAVFHNFLKKNIIFTDHSLVTDAVFSETHFISCRNVLIYFNRELQDRAFGLFHESLCRKCFLGLGSKETIQFSPLTSYFNSFTKSDRIFQKK